MIIKYFERINSNILEIKKSHTKNFIKKFHPIQSRES